MISSIPNDPPTGQVTEVDIDLIDVCHLNPRRAKNAVFDELCDSIRLNGLDNPIHISRRPGLTRYFVSGGGNTRLAVFRRLLEETGEQRFARIPSIFSPYVGDIEVLKAHLRENSQRGSLTFIDEAFALTNLRGMLEEQLGSEINDARFERILRETGFFRSRRDLGRMSYVMEDLYPYIPMALEAGLGPTAVDRLGRLHSAYLDWGKERRKHIGPAEDIDPLFFATLKAHDDAVLNEEAVRSALDAQLSILFDFTPTALRQDIETLLNGGKRLKKPPATHPAKPAVEPPAIAEGPGFAARSFVEDPPPVIKPDGKGAGFMPQAVVSDSLSVVGPDMEAGEVRFAARTVVADPRPAAEPDVEEVGCAACATAADTDHTTQLAEPHGRIRNLVSTIAEATGLQALVQWDPKAPFGFLLGELADADTFTAMVWRLLRTLSGQGFDHDALLDVSAHKFFDKGQS